VLKSSEPLRSGDRNSGVPVRSAFEIRSRTTGERYRFELEYATSGPLAGIPSVIRYQPRWWLELELIRDDGSASLTLARPAPW